MIINDIYVLINIHLTMRKLSHPSHELVLLLLQESRPGGAERGSQESASLRNPLLLKSSLSLCAQRKSIEKVGVQRSQEELFAMDERKMRCKR